MLSVSSTVNVDKYNTINTSIIFIFIDAKANVLLRLLESFLETVSDTKIEQLKELTGIY